MKKILIFILLFMLAGCSSVTWLEFSYDDLRVLNIGEMTKLPYIGADEWISDDEGIIALEGLKAYAIDSGIVDVRSTNRVITFYVKKEITDISIKGKNNLLIGEETTLEVDIKPAQIEQSVTWESLDESIATVLDGKVKAISDGLVAIKATSTFDQDWYDLYYIYVASPDKELSDIIEEIYKEEQENISNESGYFIPIVNQYKDIVVGISSYDKQGNSLSIGSGVIYKREIITEDAVIKGYKYNVITNRHVVKKAERIKIRTLKQELEIPAQVIEYDDQIDIALVEFTSSLYLPIAKIGETVQTGEIVLSIGHPRGYQYFNSVALGIISYPERYMSSDTDEDGTNDWDALYIQHDAPINEGNSGSPIINLKGEVVGINTIKLASSDIDNMGFAIPMPLVMEIISALEQGQKPVRAKLGVTVLSVKDIIASRAYYANQGIIVPDDLDYGFYVSDVSTTGIAYAAGIKPKDILLTFNNVKMLYSYILRAEITRYLIGSGEVVPLTVYRDGNIITLYVTY